VSYGDVGVDAGWTTSTWERTVDPAPQGPDDQEFDLEVQDVYDRGDAVCVIGAGSSGLAAVKNLIEHGFAVDCYERDTGVGGAWNRRHDRSPVYANTHLVTSKPLTQYPDFPIPDHWPDYPHHSRLVEYLERYADHFGLREHIWFGTEVVRLEPVGDGRWHVMIRAQGSRKARVLRYAAVVIANGHNWHPNMPDYPGQHEFLGQLMHSSAYTDGSILRDRKVLVVGSGDSGTDIAVEAAQQARKTWHSSRRGYWYTPKYLLGRPADRVRDMLWALRIPLWLRQRIIQLLIRLTLGKHERVGLPRPEHKVFASHPVVNSQLIHHIQHGDIEPRPDIARFVGDLVYFTDGSFADPDIVVFATGYQPRFEFIDVRHLNAGSDGLPNLYLNIFTPVHQTLFVAGLIQSDSGHFSLVHWQTVAIAQWLRVRREAPDRAAKFWPRVGTEAERRWTVTKMIDTPRHRYEVSHHIYLRALERVINELEGSKP